MKTNRTSFYFSFITKITILEKAYFENPGKNIIWVPNPIVHYKIMLSSCWYLSCPVLFNVLSPWLGVWLFSEGFLLVFHKWFMMTCSQSVLRKGIKDSFLPRVPTLGNSKWFPFLAHFFQRKCFFLFNLSCGVTFRS